MRLKQRCHFVLTTGDINDFCNVAIHEYNVYLIQPNGYLLKKSDR